MRIMEHPYTWYLENDFPKKRKVRDIAECAIWLTEIDSLVLLLVDPLHRRIALFEYDNYNERDLDIRKILALREDGGNPGAGVAARLKPRPPGRSGSHSEPIPDEQ